jgi:hypothetical protein
LDPDLSRKKVTKLCEIDIGSSMRTSVAVLIFILGDTYIIHVSTIVRGSSGDILGLSSKVRHMRKGTIHSPRKHIQPLRVDQSQRLDRHKK